MSEDYREQARGKASLFTDTEDLAKKVARWLLEDERSLERFAEAVADKILQDERGLTSLADGVQEQLWDGWYREIGRLTLRALLLLAGSAALALAGWLALIGKLVP